MTEYHKINALFMRDMSKPNRPLDMGKWAMPEFDYLAGNQWEFTEKVDGTNIRVYLTNSTLIDEGLQIDYLGRTDNADIPKPLLSALDTLFVEPDRKSSIESWMDDHGLNQVVLYGEGYGPKIQNGGNYREDVSFVLFDVKIGDFWLTRDNVDDIASKLGIDSVPVLGYGTLWDAMFLVKYGSHRNFPNLEPIYINGRDRLRSTWGDFESEGIVARPVVPLFNRQGNRIIAKIKSKDFR